VADQQKTEVGYERLGAGKLKLIDVLAQSIGFMGPVFSAALILPLMVGAGATGEGAGVATPVAVILAAIGIFAIGWMIAMYAKRIHAAGALYDYVTQGFGERVGFYAGWVYYWGTMALTAAIPLIIGGITYGLLHDDLGWEKTPPYWVIGLIYCAALFCLLYFGVHISTRAQLILVIVSVTVVLGFFLYIIFKGGAGGNSNSIKPFLPSSSEGGWTGIFYGVLYGILIFTGFETAANLAEETAEPKKSVPRAIFLAIGVVGIYYVIVAYAQDIGFGLNTQDWVASIATGPLFVLGSAEAFGSVNFDRLLQVIVILDILAVGLGTAVATSRGFFAMARDRRIPGVFAKVSAKHGTPVASILLTVGFCAATPIVVRLTNGLLTRDIPGVPPDVAQFPEYFPLFSWLAGFGGLALALVYAVIALGGMKGLWPGENHVKLVTAGLVGFLVAAGAIFGAIYKVPAPANAILPAVLIVLVIGIVINLVSGGRESASTALPDLRSDGGAA
jgi:amino acid transporter